MSEQRVDKLTPCAICGHSAFWHEDWDGTYGQCGYHKGCSAPVHTFKAKA